MLQPERSALSDDVVMNRLPTGNRLIAREHNAVFNVLSSSEPAPEPSETCRIVFIDFSRWGPPALVATVETDDSLSFQVYGDLSELVGDSRRGDVIKVHRGSYGEGIVSVRTSS